MTYLITGGGSGGHIYPALAVADEIKRKDSKARVVLVGSKRGMERKIFSQTKYKVHFLPVGQLHSLAGRIKQIISLFFLPICFIQSFFLLIRYRPKAVLGVGGYASGPLGAVACILKIPTYIWEANTVPGITNKILGKLNTTPLLVFPEAVKFFKKNKSIITGLPIRIELQTELETLKKEPKSSKITVLFVGGSLGAKVFNDVLPEFIKKFGDKLKDFNFIHQTGFKNYESTLAKYPMSHDVKVLSYLDPIKTYYESADLVICRSGASTVVELSVMGKPSILVPLSNSSDNHQKKNAESMVKKGAAIMIEEAQFSIETLYLELLSIKQNPTKFSNLGDNCKSSFSLGAREKIADIMLKTSTKREPHA